jgi:hypothetical protein
VNELMRLSQYRPVHTPSSVKEWHVEWVIDGEFVHVTLALSSIRSNGDGLDFVRWPDVW